MSCSGRSSAKMFFVAVLALCSLVVRSGVEPTAVGCTCSVVVGHLTRQNSDVNDGAGCGTRAEEEGKSVKTKDDLRRQAVASGAGSD